MIKSYLKIALRNLYKHKLYSIINIFGLGVAMALCVVGYVNYQFSQSFDSFHENKDNIYLVNTFSIQNNNRQKWTFSPTPLAPSIKENYSGIEECVRIAFTGGILRHEDKVFNELLYFVDKKFFDMFTFPMLLGSKDALEDESSIVISDVAAKKYFGEENPIGKRISITPDGEKQFEFIIRGVIEQPGKNSSLSFTVCVPYEKQEELRGFDLQSWNDWTSATFIQLNGEVSAPQIEERLQEYTQITNEANPRFEIDGFYLTHLPDLTFTTRDLGGNPFRNGMHPAAIVAPSVTALLVLLLACFNFINTAVAFASKRLNEIGVRKVVGGMRSQLIKQFMGENLILCFIALIIAAAFSEIFVPAYDSLWPELSLSMNYSENLGLVGFLIGLLLFTGFAAGAYPAFYISGFNPAEIFKGKQKLGGTNPLIRILLTFQLALSMTVVIAAIILTQNAKYIDTLDLGYHGDQVLVVPIRSENQYMLIKNAIEDHPGITAIGGSRNLMGRSWYTIDVESEGLRTRANVFEIGENFAETIGFEFTDGRPFDSNLATDIDNAVIVNERFVEEFGLSSAVDKHVKFTFRDSLIENRIVGVVKDFFPFDVGVRVRPTLLRFAPYDRYQYLSIKCDPQNISAASSYVQETWKELFPNQPYDGFWQDETLAESRLVNQSIRVVFIYIAVMVLIISSMGLFALVSLNIAKRTKEIGIRKILGASMSNLCILIAKEFVLLILIGGALATVMGYFLVDSLLSSIWEYYTDFGVTPFVLATVMIFGVSVLTVSFRVFGAATANPVEALRYE